MIASHHRQHRVAPG